MKIKNIILRVLRNTEHFQFIKETVGLIILIGALSMKILKEFETLRACFRAEDEAYKKIVKSKVTDKIETADKRRDNTWRGVIDAVKSALRHYEPNVVEAAKRILIVINTFGNIAAKALNEGTADFYNLLQELNKNYADDLKTLNLEGWTAQLEAENKECEQLIIARNDEKTGKTKLTMKQCREDTDRAFYKLVDRINALILVDGDEDYAEFVDKLNGFIDTYNNAVARRRGKSKTKKNAAADDDSTNNEVQIEN
jgi:hypothetical protein